MVTIFDTHFHYDGEGDFSEYLAELPTDYNFLLMANGTTLSDCHIAQATANTFENVYYTIGVHPLSAAKEQADIAEFAVFRGDASLKAIGEIGLDYFYSDETKAVQLTKFKQFLDLALQWNLPAVVHIRDKEDSFTAYQDAYELLKPFAQAGGSFSIHCFSANPEWAERFLALGAYLGVTGIVTFKRAENIREILKVIPMDRLLLETDSPYLAPVPYRGKTNHPKYMVEIVNFVATEKGYNSNEFAQLTTENGKRFFKIEE